MTQKEIAHILLKRLINLEIEQVAMAVVLDASQRPDWRQSVRRLRDDSEFRRTALEKYADQVQKIQASTDECPDALSVLESVARGLV